MGTLTVAPSCYVFKDTSQETGNELGLTLSTHPNACKPGEFTFFTSRRIRGKDTPVKNPYAVLPVFNDADDAATLELLDHWLRYEESWATSAPDGYPAPAGLDYMPYQNAGISYAMSRKHVLLGDAPGLGKTIEAIGVCNAVDAGRILVICPAAVRLQWANELEKWSVRPRSRWATGERRIYPVMASSGGIDMTAGAVIASYNLAASGAIADLLAQQRFDVVIFDEAHYLKSYTAERTRRLLGSWGDEGAHAGQHHEGLVANAGRVLALTGTPLPNRPREAYTIARALDWNSIDCISEKAFQARYNPQVTLGNGHRLEFTKDLLELQTRLRCNFMVRRLKEDVLQDLPDKTYELAYIEPDGAVKKVLRAEKLLNIDPENLSGDAEVMGAIATVRREMGRAKAPGVLAHIKMLLDGGVNKLVVFAYHTEVIAYLRNELPGMHTCIQGATSAQAREDAKERFRTDPDCRVFIGQLTAAGTGVDGLQTVCSHAVFAEASWTPGENEQCIDRLHRYGQKAGVLCQFLVAPGSLDERILGSAIRKVGTINRTLDHDIRS